MNFSEFYCKAASFSSIDNLCCRFNIVFGAFLNPSDSDISTYEESFKILSLLATILAFVISTIRFCELSFDAECFLAGFSLLLEI
jgi:hypothetical protein